MADNQYHNNNNIRNRKRKEPWRNVSDRKLSSKKIARPGQTVCELCNIVFPKEKNAVEHFKGKRHALAVKAREDKEKHGLSSTNVHIDEFGCSTVQVSNSVTKSDQQKISDPVKVSNPVEKSDVKNGIVNASNDVDADVDLAIVKEKDAAEKSTVKTGSVDAPIVLDSDVEIVEICNPVEKIDETTGTKSTPIVLDEDVCTVQVSYPVDKSFVKTGITDKENESKQNQTANRNRNLPAPNGASSNNNKGVDAATEQATAPLIADENVDSAPKKDEEPKPKVEIYCEVCNITLDSATNAEQHFKGKRHAFALENKAMREEQEKQSAILSRWQGGNSANRGRTNQRGRGVGQAQGFSQRGSMGRRVGTSRREGMGQGEGSSRRGGMGRGEGSSQRGMDRGGESSQRGSMDRGKGFSHRGGMRQAEKSSQRGGMGRGDGFQRGGTGQAESFSQRGGMGQAEGSSQRGGMGQAEGCSQRGGMGQAEGCSQRGGRDWGEGFSQGGVMGQRERSPQGGGMGWWEEYPQRGQRGGPRGGARGAQQGRFHGDSFGLGSRNSYMQVLEERGDPLLKALKRYYGSSLPSCGSSRNNRGAHQQNMSNNIKMNSGFGNNSQGYNGSHSNGTTNFQNSNTSLGS